MTQHQTDYIKALEAIADAVIAAGDSCKHTHEGVTISRSSHLRLKDAVNHAAMMGAYVKREEMMR